MSSTMFGLLSGLRPGQQDGSMVTMSEDEGSFEESEDVEMAGDDEDVVAEVAVREFEKSAVALASIEAYAREKQAAVSRQSVDAAAARAAVKESGDSWYSKKRRSQPKGDRVSRAIAVLEALEALEEDNCHKLKSSYESLRAAARTDAQEAGSAVADSSDRLNRYASNARRAEQAVRRARLAVHKAQEAASVAEDDQAEAARTCAVAAAKAMQEFELASNSDAARRTSQAADRAQLAERRCQERVRESYARVNRETAELRSAADAAVRAVAEREKCERAAADASLKLVRDFAEPRALEALRELARYERGRIEAKIALLDKLEAVVDEPPVRPPLARRKRCVGRALELLKEARDEAPQPQQSSAHDAAIDAHLGLLFADSDRLDDVPELPAQQNEKRRDVLRAAAAAAGFDAEAASKLAAGVLGRRTQSAPLPTVDHPVSNALVTYVDESRDRAAAVARAMNRQRSKQTAVPSKRALQALAAVANTIIQVCRQTRDDHTPGVVLMLAQTFYLGGPDRTSRKYLKDYLHDDFLHDRHFLQSCVAQAARTAVKATTGNYPPYWDIIFSDKQAEVASHVHRAVHAQLAAFCFALHDLGLPNSDVTHFASLMCHDYQLPCQERAVLLAPYRDEDGEDHHREPDDARNSVPEDDAIFDDEVVNV